MSIDTLLKDPGDNRSYGLSFADWCQSTDLPIDTFAWTIPTGLTVGVQGVQPAVTENGQTIADSGVFTWLSGGTLDAVYDCVCHVTNNLGEHYEATMRIKMKNRYGKSEEG